MSRLKDKFASGFGSILEWYDFSLYGYFVPVFAKLYFPLESETAAVIKTFIVFAIGFIARPLGGMLFGYIGDKYGRAFCLKLTPLLITVPTALFAFLPTHAQIGISATIMLVTLRIWQGICLGGEFTNNIVYLCESTSKKYSYFLGSIGSCTGSFGILLASSMASLCYILLPTNILSSFGWRMAFGVSAILGVVTYLLRRNLAETSTYQQLHATRAVIKNPLIISLQNQWRTYLLAFGLSYLSATAFYFCFMFLPNYMSTVLHVPSGKALSDNSVSLLARLFIIPIGGMIAGYVGGIRMTRIACLSFIILSAPFFGLIIRPSHTTLFAIYGLTLLTTINAATLPGLLVEILPPQTRCIILSTTFNVCFGVLGGLVPTIGLLLAKNYPDSLAPVYYLIFSAIITLSSTFFIKEGNKYEEHIFTHPNPGNSGELF